MNGEDLLYGCIWADPEDAALGDCLFADPEDLGPGECAWTESPENAAPDYLESQFQSKIRGDAIFITFLMPGDFLSWDVESASFVGEKDLIAGSPRPGSPFGTIQAQRSSHGSVPVLTLAGNLRDGSAYEAVALGLLNRTDALLVQHYYPRDVARNGALWVKFLDGFAVWDDERSSDMSGD